MDSLSILTQNITALDLKAKQLVELKVSWNSVYRHLFGFHKWESVRGYVKGMSYYTIVNWQKLCTKRLLRMEITRSVMRTGLNLIIAFLKDNLCFIVCYKSRSGRVLSSHPERLGPSKLYKNVCRSEQFLEDQMPFLSQHKNV